MSNKDYNLKENKVFCMAPWMHTHIWPNGDVFPCCMFESEMPLTNYKKEGDLKTVWNSEKYKTLRYNMLNGIQSTGCNRCYEQENNGKYNLRNQLNNDFAHHYHLVEETNTDGSLDKIDLVYLDIRFSNVCNLTCRTCGPDLSSSWGLELAVTRPSETKKPALIRIEAGSKNKEFWNDLSQYIENVERIYFAGGEPLLMQEHYNILQYLEERKMFNIKIYYNTNFSTLDFKSTTVLEYWKKFNNIIVCASLDGSHEKGELIRKGLDWEQVVENRKRMIKECPNVRFILAPTVSVYNADHVLDFYEEWLKLGLVNKYDIQFNVLLLPQSYRIELLPDDVKQRINAKIDMLVEEAQKDSANSKFKDYRIEAFILEITQFKNALNKTVDEKYKEEMLIDLNNRINELDKIRNESTWDIFPTLLPLKR